MNPLDKFSKNLAYAVKTNVKGIDEDKHEVISYGIYLLISDVIKTAIILSAAYFLGIFSYSILAMAGFGLLRSMAGGVHAKTWTGCLLANSAITFGVVYGSLALQAASPFLLAALLYPASIITIYLYAPSDHENKPVVSKKQKKHLRIMSFLVLTLQYIIALIFVKQPVSSILMLAAAAVGISLLPLTYKITANRRGDAYPGLLIEKQ